MSSSGGTGHSTGSVRFFLAFLCGLAAARLLLRTSPCCTVTARFPAHAPLPVCQIRQDVQQLKCQGMWLVIPHSTMRCLPMCTKCRPSCQLPIARGVARHRTNHLNPLAAQQRSSLQMSTSQTRAATAHQDVNTHCHLLSEDSDAAVILAWCHLLASRLLHKTAQSCLQQHSATRARWEQIAVHHQHRQAGCVFSLNLLPACSCLGLCHLWLHCRVAQHSQHALDRLCMDSCRPAGRSSSQADHESGRREDSTTHQ